MLSTLRNAFKVPDLRKRLLITLFMIALFRIGNFIPVPGVDTAQLTKLTADGSLFGFYDLLSGGAFSKFSIFAMGVFPYINASIIIQLLTVAIPSLEQLSKEGEEGRKKIQEYTKYSAVVLSLIQAYSQYAIISRYNAIPDSSKFNAFIIILTLTTASTFLVWYGDIMTQKGIGNGVSLLIFINIISKVPQNILQIVGVDSDAAHYIQVVLLFVVTVALFIAVVVVSLAERRIPVQYAGKTATGGKMFKGQSTHIPININGSAVIGIIFAMSVLGFPETIAQFWPNSWFYNFVTGNPYSVFRRDTWFYAAAYFVLIIFFTWFYTQITFKPDEMAENMHKSSGFIPGIRPGAPTEKHIERILNKTSIIGGIFAAIVAVFPIIIQIVTPFKNLSFSGTTLLITVGVALDTLRQIESQLVMRHYQGFLK